MKAKINSIGNSEIQKQHTDSVTILDRMKVSVAECLININVKMEGPFIPPTAIDWIANDIVTALKAIISKEKINNENIRD